MTVIYSGNPLLVQILLFQPQIAANFGAIIRSCACLGANLAVVEPCGFPLSAKTLRRAAMDYGQAGDVARFADWTAFEAASGAGRKVLFTTKGATPLTQFQFRPDDTLIFGNEGAGAPEAVHSAADARVVIPLAAGARSLNLSNTVAIALFEALRQKPVFPSPLR